MQSTGSRYYRERLKYQQERTVCPSVIAVLWYVEHVVKKYQVHRRHRVCTVVREYHRPEQIHTKRSCVLIKKIDQTYNKITDGVKFVVIIIPSDDHVIGVGRKLLKMLPQTQEPDNKCRELNVLVLFPLFLILNGHKLSVMLS
jgi:hypothetical protein